MEEEVVVVEKVETKENWEEAWRGRRKREGRRIIVVDVDLYEAEPKGLDVCFFGHPIALMYFIIGLSDSKGWLLVVVVWDDVT